MASAISLCSIGMYLNEDCDQDNDKPKQFSEFSAENKKLLELRCNLKSIHTVCWKHERFYLGQFVGKQRYCCDPFQRHAIV